MSLKIKALSKDHIKGGFDCGNALLNDYIQKQAKQDVNRDLCACYVLDDNIDGIVLGYYTLSGNSISREEFPADLIKKMPPSYTNLPAILIGRLAIDNKFKGKGLGAILLIDALKRCAAISESLGVLAVIVDAIDENAARFYESYGFIRIGRKLFIPIKTIRDSE